MKFKISLNRRCGRAFLYAQNVRIVDRLSLSLSIHLLRPCCLSFEHYHCEIPRRITLVDHCLVISGFRVTCSLQTIAKCKLQFCFTFQYHCYARDVVAVLASSLIVRLVSRHRRRGRLPEHIRCPASLGHLGHIFLLRVRGF